MGCRSRWVDRPRQVQHGHHRRSVRVSRLRWSREHSLQQETCRAASIALPAYVVVLATHCEADGTDNRGDPYRQEESRDRLAWSAGPSGWGMAAHQDAHHCTEQPSLPGCSLVAGLPVSVAGRHSHIVTSVCAARSVRPRIASMPTRAEARSGYGVCRHRCVWLVSPPPPHVDRDLSNRSGPCRPRGPPKPTQQHWSG